MKYYHIIYNSSQNTQSGSVGFGVRTFTEGTPQEYIDLLRDNDYFGYSSGNLPQPSPNALLEDGSIVLRYPVTYSFAKYPVPNMERDVYVVARTVNVGFDYPYYVKFTVARVGNFVVDAYVFEEMPPVEVFDLFYEQPAEGSAAFVPRNPVPSPDNEEMKTLSLDKMELLAPEEKRFARQQNQPVSGLALELLFAFLEAERDDMPLLVKCPKDIAAPLMTDLLHLLPQNLREKAFFYTNYQSEGVKEGYKVFFVNETNTCDYEMTGQFLVFDTTQSQTMNTPESAMYRDELTKLCNEGNTQEFTKLVHWMLSPQYAAIKDKSAQTKRVMYDYIVNPDKFSFQGVDFRDEEFLTTLKDYFTKDRNNQAVFDNLLTRYLEDERIRGKQLVEFVAFCHRMLGRGFDLNAVVEKERTTVTTKLVESPEVFKMALDSVGINGLTRFLDKRVLEQHEQLLDGQALRDDWAKIYRYFYTEDKLKDPVSIILRMFSLSLKSDVIDEVVKGFGVDDLWLCSYYTEAARRDSSQLDLAWKRTWDILQLRMQQGLPLPDAKLAAGIDQIMMAPLMQDPELQNGVVECKTLIDLLQGNLHEGNFDAIFNLVLKLNKSQYYRVLYDRGMPLVKEHQVKPFLNAVLKQVQPDAKDFVARAENHRLKMELLTEYFMVYDLKERKKQVERMRKDNTLHLNDEEYQKLLVALGLVKEKEKEKEKEQDKDGEGKGQDKGKGNKVQTQKPRITDDDDSDKRKLKKFLPWLIGLGAGVLFLLALVVGRSIIHSTKSEDETVIEQDTPQKKQDPLLKKVDPQDVNNDSSDDDSSDGDGGADPTNNGGDDPANNGGDDPANNGGDDPAKGGNKPLQAV